jgi:MoaA/NifB/PqqE/SkfB family radical SAM enzyme
MKDIKSSYSSAGSEIPVKLVLNDRVLNIIKNKKLQPVSVGLNPTNKCNLSCDFCSCKDRDKGVSLDIKRIKEFFDRFSTIQSCIITGGGEPLLYDDFEELVSFLHGKGILIGLVTNGMMLAKQKISIINKINWIRVSLSVDSMHSGIYEIMRCFVKSPIETNLSFSYVCSEDVRRDALAVRPFYSGFIHDINHFRVVNDLFILDERVERLRNYLLEEGDYSKMIFQERTEYTRGHERCCIAMLKPNIAADGHIYPCCGAQYALLGEDKRDYNKTFLSMGKIENAEEIWTSNCFDGSVCNICYYSGYNLMIEKLMGDVDDLEFV